MIYEYAVSPRLFASSKDAGFLLDSFGKGKGRLISKLPRKKWLQLAFQEINKSPFGPLERKKLKNAANKLLRHASYDRRGEQPDFQNNDWLELALSAHKQLPFRGILAEQASSQHKEILVNDLSLRENELWQIPQSVTVERDAKTMMDAIQPVLEAAKTIILVDRNFETYKKRFVNVLLECIQRVSAKQFGPKVQKISYHLGDKRPCHFIQDEIKPYLKQIPEGFTVDFVLHPWDDLHDRFILTDIGGVEFGVGLDESLGGGTKTVRIKRMPEADYNTEWKKASQAQPSCSITRTK